MRRVYAKFFGRFTGTEIMVDRSLGQILWKVYWYKNKAGRELRHKKSLGKILSYIFTHNGITHTLSPR